MGLYVLHIVHKTKVTETDELWKAYSTAELVSLWTDVFVDEGAE